MDKEDKFKDCFDAFSEFEDHFGHHRKLLGLLMHFTLRWTIFAWPSSKKVSAMFELDKEGF
jgi:hypothetical protein